MNLSNLSSTGPGSEEEDVIYSAIWKAVYLLILIPTVLGNVLIISSIVRFSKLRNKMHVLVGNLAFSDLLVGAVLVPYDFIAEMTDLNSNKYFCLCKLAFFILSLGGSCFSLLLISIERFSAIVFPLLMRNFFTKHKLIGMITLGWVYVLALAILPVLGWNAYLDHQTECLSDELWAHGYEMLTNWAFIACLIANFILYTVVISVALKKARVRRLRRRMNVHPRSDRDFQKLITMVIVMGVFALCWFPYVSMIITVTFYDTLWIRFIKRCCIIPGLLNSGVNWLIYGLRNRDFREAFKAILKCQGEKNWPRQNYRHRNTSNRNEVHRTVSLDSNSDQYNPGSSVFSVSRGH